MALKLKFLDVAKVKELVLQKGERVGLAIAVGLSVLILGYGLWNGMSAGSPPPKYETSNWRDAIAKKNEALKDAVGRSTPPPKGDGEEFNVLKGIGWPLVPHENKEPSPWVVLSDGQDSKRQKPTVLSIRVGDKEIQMDYVRAPVLVYSNQPKTRKVDILVPKGATQVDTSKLAEKLEPRRMVVVSAVFPLKDQLELIRHALRLYTLEEAMMPENAPQFIGLNVMRCEIMPNGRAKEKAKDVVDWMPLYNYDPKKEEKKEQPFVLAEHLVPLFRDGTVDDVNVQLHANFLYHGLSTPLPKLAHGSWPEIALNGIETPKIEGEQKAGMMPPTSTGPGPGQGGLNLPGSKGGAPGEGGNMPQAQGPDQDYKSIDWKDVSNVEIKNRLMGYFHAFNPLGSWTLKDVKSGGANLGGPGESAPGGSAPAPGPGPGRTGGTPAPGPGEGVGPGASVMATEINNLLARFVDVDVQPGKTYRYAVKVIMANPNFGRKNDVAFESLSKDKELYSAWAVTPAITIPGDFYYYAYAMEGNKVEVPVQRDGSDEKQPLPEYHPLYGQNAVKMSNGQATMQLHKWIPVADGRFERGIGDFAIAERVLVNRGQLIGRPNFMVDIPVWDPLMPGFTLQNVSLNTKKGTKFTFKEGRNTGVPINFLQEGGKGNPVLVDFVEGTRANRYVGKSGISDEVAQELLVLTPEGKLIVRNARQDTDGDPDPVTRADPPSKDRKARFDNWLNRLRAIRQAFMPAAMPGGTPGPGEGR